MSFGIKDLWKATPLGMAWKPLKQATGLTDAQMIGIGALAVAAPFAAPAIMGAGGAGAAGVAGSGAAGAGAAGAAGTTAGAAGAQGGILSTFGQYAGPASQAMNIAGQAQAMTQGQQMQVPPAQFAQGQGFGGLLNPTDQVDPRKRQQAQQTAVQGLLGGYGRNYG